MFSDVGGTVKPAEIQDGVSKSLIDIEGLFASPRIYILMYCQATPDGCSLALLHPLLNQLPLHTHEYPIF